MEASLESELLMKKLLHTEHAVTERESVRGANGVSIQVDRVEKAQVRSSSADARVRQASGHASATGSVLGREVGTGRCSLPDSGPAFGISTQCPRLDASFGGQSVSLATDTDPLRRSFAGTTVADLENKMQVGNSLAALRTTLANERTFLAWLRTGAALVACGLAIDRTMKNQSAVATTFVVCGFSTSLQGVVRYYQVRNKLDKLIRRIEGDMELNGHRLGIKWFVLAVMSVVGVCAAYIAIRLSMHPSA